MAKKKLPIKNIFFLVVIALLLIPETRKPIQVALHTMIGKISPSLEKEDEITKLSSYNWRLKDLNGNNFNLKEAKGKVLFVNVWATWCPPCIAEMPSIQELYNDYNDKIKFVLVSNEEQTTIKSFLKKKNYSLNTFIPQTQFPQTFNVKSIPRTFLIDKEGNVIIDESGAANWNSQVVRNTIDELLKK